MKKIIIIILSTLVFTACDTDNIKDNKPDPIINPGDTPDNPITRIENRQLTTVAWVELLNEIENEGKYVALDLSACTRGKQTSGGGLWSNGIFYTDPYLGTRGIKKIVSLILPETATGFPEPRIQGESMGLPIYEAFFGNFSVLKEITGINIITIERNAFISLGTLYSPDDGHIMWSRGILTSVNFPNVITIGEDAFNGCYNLTYANIPKVQIIKDQAFIYCNLQSLYIPDIRFMDIQALQLNNSLTEFVFGEVAPTMSYKVIGFASTAKSRNITVKVPMGATGYGEIPSIYIGGDTSKNWGNAFRGMGWRPDRANMPISFGTAERYDANGFGPIDRINTGITLRIEYIPTEKL